MPHTENCPKCLITIGGKTILEHQLDAVAQAGISHAVIVIGYLKEKIVQYIGNRYDGINAITYIENPDYKDTNTIYSLYLARDEFRDEDFIYFNGDVLFHKQIVSLLAHHTLQNVLAVDYKRCGEEEVKFSTDGNRRIIKLGKYISPSEAEGEFIGVARFGRNVSADFIDRLEHYSDSGKRNLFFEKAVEDILETDTFFPLDVTDIPNIEIDYPEDLEEAKNTVYPGITEYEKKQRK